jgi:hypothetical protein
VTPVLGGEADDSLMRVVLIILILLLSATALSASAKSPVSLDGASIHTATHPGCSGSSKGKEAKAIRAVFA